MPLRSSTLQHRGRTHHGTPLLVSRLPIHRWGSGTVNVFFPSEAVKVEGALSDYTNQAASVNLMHRQFCPKCGSYMVFRNQDSKEVSVNTASLDDPASFPPRMHIFTESRIPWFPTQDDLPQHVGYGPFQRVS